MSRQRQASRTRLRRAISLRYAATRTKHFTSASFPELRRYRRHATFYQRDSIDIEEADGFGIDINTTLFHYRASLCYAPACDGLDKASPIPH